jgi:CHAD domain-containing protein
MTHPTANPDPALLQVVPGLTALEAVRRLHLGLLATVRRHAANLLDRSDPEALHDFRVAVRRTRVLLGQVDRDVLPAAVVARAKADFRWLGRETNRLRDLDVYLQSYPELRDLVPEGVREHLRPFRDHLASAARAENARLAEVVAGPRFGPLLAAWEGYFGELFFTGCIDAGKPVGALAAARIRGVHARVLREGAAIDDASPDAALHDLRIRCKKLRYLLEFFADLYPARRMRRLVKALKALQEVLGTFQDASVQSSAILDFGRAMAAAGDVPVDTELAMGMLAEAILQRQAEARAAFHAQFEAFAGTSVSREFSRLFEGR